MLVHFDQLCKQVIETPLLRQDADFVIGAPEVADQGNSGEGIRGTVYTIESKES